jgi:hypothetical protein
MQLVQVLNPDSPARYSRDGRRISKAEYDRLIERAIADGRYSCASTQAKQLPGGKFKRWNYTSIGGDA